MWNARGVLACIVVAVVLCVAIWRRGEAQSAPSAGGTDASMRICRLGSFSDRAYRSAITDSAWRPLTSGVAGSQVLNKHHRWALDFYWFQSSNFAGRLLTIGQMQELARTGVVNDTMKFDVVNYRCVVRANSADEARRAAERKHMKMPPRWMLRRLGVPEDEGQ